MKLVNTIKNNFRLSDFITWYVIMAILLIVLEVRNNPEGVTFLGVVITLITALIPAAIFSFFFRLITGWIVKLNE
ncbi:hypothetical protein ACFSGI_03590 [Paenibacillus nicotianae]|uniref:Uncharacterized protein n=1 Tax=Paenibacillus nicotianae TaxID=1526551 RepID=A0ABW4UPQ1_9BACL